MSGISKSQVSKICEEIDGRVHAFLNRRIEGEWPYLWLDATYLKVREGNRVISIAAILATGVNRDGRREILGLGLGLRRQRRSGSACCGLQQTGLAGVKLVISDSREGLKATITQVFTASWQRCRVHFMRNTLAHVSKAQHSMVAAAPSSPTIPLRQRRKPGATLLVSCWPRCRDLAALMDQAETDVLAFMAFPRQHWPKLHSTNPLEGLNKEVKRRADVVGIFPNQASIMRLFGAILLEQNDEWQLQHRYMPLETMAGLGEEQINSLPALNAKAA
jgi:putative transposase